MAGHSKWANIQYRKNAQDAKRGKIFTKLIREITVAARMGGGDISTNSRLRLVLDKAFTANMTRDTVERAIKRGVGGEEGQNMEAIRYEGYGPGGVAVMVECLTDNRTRTVSEVRHAFSKYGGNLGTDGCVAYLFTKRGILTFPPQSDEARIMEVAIEAGAEDVQTQSDGSIEVITDPEQFTKIKDAMQKAGLTAAQAEVTMIAATTVPLDSENSEKMMTLLETLEDLDDVQAVYSNAQMASD